MTEMERFPSVWVVLVTELCLLLSPSNDGYEDLMGVKYRKITLYLHMCVCAHTDNRQVES